MPPPILINAVFFIFPIGVIAACITIFTWFSSVLNPFLDEVFNILDILRQGSSIWDQLRIPSTSSEQKYQLVTNLTQVASRAQSVGRNLKIHFQDVVHSLMVLQWVLLSLTCTAVVVRTFNHPLKGNTSVTLWQVLASETITDTAEHPKFSQVFVLVFYKLAWRFHEQANQSSTSTINQSSPIQEQRWQSQGDPPSMIQHRSNHTHRTFFDTVRSNPQFRMFNNISCLVWILFF
jgi:hypothetical protein